MKFHVLTGLPRSGSTLVANILSQRDDTWVSSTSALSRAVAGISEIHTTSEESLSELANIPEAKDIHANVLRSVVESWHGPREEENVIDKSRGWTHQTVLLRSIYPTASIIVTVRDPRDILASIEKRHRETGQYGAGTLWERNSAFMSETGIVGACIAGVEDMIRRDWGDMIFLDHDFIVKAPERAFGFIDDLLGSGFDYDFKNVKNTSTDLDAQWRGKFPHKGEGEVKPYTGDWREYISEDIARASIERWPLYCRTFGYR